MTMQVRDGLTVRGRSFALLDLPLRQCDDPAVRARLALLCPTSTANWRGYVAGWAIRGGKLWLCALSANVGDGTKPPQHVERRGLDWLFPDRPAPVHADWVSGELTSGRGKAQRFGMFGMGWPYLRRYRIDAGIVVSSELIDNRKKLREDVRSGSGLLKLLEE